MKTARIFLGFFVFLIVAIGLVVLASAGGRKGEVLLASQAVNLLVALAAGFMAAWVDYRKWMEAKWLMPLAYTVTVGLLAFVLTQRGIKGSKRWIALGSFNLQPGEIAKLMAVFIAAWWASAKRTAWMEKVANPPPKSAKWWKKLYIRLRKIASILTDGYWPAVAMLGVIAALVAAEPDVGTTCVVAGVSGLVMFMAGVRWKHILAGGLLVVLAMGAVVWSIPNRRERFLGYLNRGEVAENQVVDEKTKAKNYQIDQSLVAFGNAMRTESVTPFWDPAHYHPWWGALTGMGYMNGMQKLSYLPEHHTDFIFAVGAEELGFLFSITVVLLFTGFFLCAMVIARRAADPLGRYIALGMGALIYFQALYNMGAVTGALPAKGLALPFVSYGGTHLIMEAVAVGSIISVSLRNNLQNRKNKSKISFNT